MPRLAQRHGRASNGGPSRATPKARGWPASMPSLAGIASARAASEYGLLHRRPGDPRRCAQPDSLRRARSSRPPSAAQGRGHDCISLVVSVDNRPGAVHDMLAPLKDHGVSMTRFESRPARSGQWEYYFYIDLEGHPDQPEVAAALAELRGACAFFKLLGTYPVDTH